MSTQLLRHARQPRGLVGQMRQHGDHPQLGLGAQGVGERLGDLGRPQVLVLDVDESFGPLECFGVAPRHTPLATAGERVVATVSKVRIGPQQLDQVRTAGHRWPAAVLAAATDRAEGHFRPSGRAAAGSGSGSAASDPSSAPGTPSRRRSTAGPEMAAWMSCHAGCSP